MCTLSSTVSAGGGAGWLDQAKSLREHAPLDLSIAKAQMLLRRIFEVKYVHYTLFVTIMLKLAHCDREILIIGCVTFVPLVQGTTVMSNRLANCAGFAYDALVR